LEKKEENNKEEDFMESLQGKRFTSTQKIKRRKAEVGNQAPSPETETQHSQLQQEV
jgi:hypothetical protein